MNRTARDVAVQMTGVVCASHIAASRRSFGDQGMVIIGGPGC